ncbi:MAG TPA: 50S ribosomal protein L29 [Candidatus Polarisedimenticolia bacterium]|nr:50S ribosomal protein L29 [Candidatus Polarisedimenticolia bacterium]
MKALRASALREKTMEELLKDEEDLQTQLFKLRFQQSTGQAENPHRIRGVRRDLARVKTVLNEKRTAAQS